MTEQNETWSEELAALSFEDAYRRLEDTVNQLEQGELALTDAESLYRQGMDLATRCQQLLSEAELRITQIGDDRGIAEPAANNAPGNNASGNSAPVDDGDEWDLPPPLEPDDPSLFEDDDAPF